MNLVLELWNAQIVPLTGHLATLRTQSPPKTGDAAPLLDSSLKIFRVIDILPRRFRRAAQRLRSESVLRRSVLGQYGTYPRFFGIHNAKRPYHLRRGPEVRFGENREIYSSSPMLSLTAFLNLCLQPRYCSAVNQFPTRTPKRFAPLTRWMPAASRRLLSTCRRFARNWRLCK